MSKLSRVLIANRGEIAVRVARAVADLGLQSVAVFSEDDAESPHRRHCHESRPLAGRGAAAYLDAEQIVAVALEAGCDAIHPGYGFLSENADFARLCRDSGLAFVGPSVRTFSNSLATRRRPAGTQRNSECRSSSARRGRRPSTTRGRCSPNSAPAAPSC